MIPYIQVINVKDLKKKIYQRLDSKNTFKLRSKM